MSNEKNQKRSGRRKRVRKTKLVFNIIIVIIIVYLVTIALSLFGGGTISSTLRSVDFIDVPAKFAEENLIVLKSLPEIKAKTITIVISEDKIYYNDEEILIDALSQIISDSETEKVKLVDDDAKRVTYASVYDELEELGVIIE